MRKLVAAVVLAPALALAQVPIRPQPTDPQGRPLPAGPLPTTPTGPSATPPPAPSPAPRAAPSATPPRATSPGGAQAPGNGRARSNANTEPLRATDARCVPLQGRFMLSFNKADIVDILEQASRWTCRNFVYTDDIARGKITLLSKTPVTADEAYAAFLAALNSNNISVYATGRYYKLIRTADSKKNPIPTYTGPSSETPANEQPVTKVIRLQYADADQMRGIVGNFLSPQGADVQSVPPDMLIVTDIALNLRRIERILDAVDRAGAGDLVRIVQIRYAAAKDIADKINQIFQAQGPKAARRSFGTPSPAAPRPPGVTAVPAPAPAAPAGAAGADRPGEVSVSKILPDERTNKLIIIADEKGFQRIQELIDQLDVPTSGEGGIHVVFLRNANAEELAQTLSNLAQGRARRQGGAPGAPAGVPTPGAPQLPQVRPASTGLPGAGGDVTAELFSGEVKITSDKAQNALLIQASGADFLALQRLIERLDRPRRQVFVEAVILEVTLRNDVELGVGAHAAVPFDYKGDTGIIPIASEPGRVSSFNLLQAAGLGGFLTGFSGPVTAEIKNLGFAFPSIGFLVQALQSSSDANVLSTPHIVATDNEESEITVGQNVPFQAGYTPSGLSSLLAGASSTSTTGTTTPLGGLTGLTGLSGLIAPIQRQPVELRVKIKPQINEGGNVRLSVDAQNEEITERDAQLGPTTSKRTVKTQIVARDQSTIVIGGLIQERNVRSVKRIPLLGSLPVVGWLFRDQQTTKQKTNLLIFLTPYIIRDESDYRRIYERKRKEQQQFIEQFYGRQPAYEVDVDFARKAGPYTRMHSGVVEESSRLENGGTGGPGERIAPARGERGAPPSLGPPQGDRPQGAVPPAPVPPRQPPEREEEGTPVDRLEVQPDVPAPPGDQDGQTAPPAPAPQSPSTERPPG